jgi:hypothetical protein
VTTITGVDLTYGEPALTTPAGVFAFSDIKRLMNNNTYGADELVAIATGLIRRRSAPSGRISGQPTRTVTNPAPHGVFWELRP